MIISERNIITLANADHLFVDPDFCSNYYDDSSCPECGALVIECVGGWTCDKECGWENIMEAAQ